MKKIKDVSILGIRSKTKVSKNVLKNARKLKSIGAFSIGTDQIDLESAIGFGVSVFNAPYQNTRSVVELAIGEMIMLMRGAFDKRPRGRFFAHRRYRAEASVQALALGRDLP